MSVYLGLIILICVIMFIDSMSNNFDLVITILILVTFSGVFLLFSAICSEVCYTTKAEYLEIVPKEGICFKNLDGYNYLVNVNGKDTLVQEIQRNSEIVIPRIKKVIQYRKSSSWYWLVQNEKQDYWVLEIPVSFYEIPKEYRVEKMN